MFSKVVFSLGNGRRVSFWKDIWCGEEAFCDAFPSMYALASNKEAFVADMWEHSREEGGWSPCFTRRFNDWELDEVHGFFQTIQRMRVLPRQDDILVFREAKDGRYSVKLLYRALDRLIVVLFPFCLIWNAGVPTRVSFFAWEASWSTALT